MRIIALALALIFVSATYAEAQQRGGYGNGNGYRQYNRGGNYAYRGGNYNNSFNRNVYVNNRGGWNGNGAAWAAGVGGLAVGALLGSALAAPAYAAPAYPYPAYGYGPPVVYAQPNCQRVQVIYPNGARSNQVVCN